jgi:serine/threonine protein kinase
MFMGRIAPAGTPPYMSPEQILGGNVDSRSDIWSAGITLFEMLTQERPFQGRTIAELVNNIVTAGVPKLSPELRFGHNLEIILERALAKRRELRYATADDFAADLRFFIRSMQEPSSEGQTVRVDGHEIISQNPSPPSDLARESITTFYPVALLIESADDAIFRFFEFV